MEKFGYDEQLAPAAEGHSSDLFLTYGLLLKNARNRKNLCKRAILKPLTFKEGIYM